MVDKEFDVTAAIQEVYDDMKQLRHWVMSQKISNGYQAGIMMRDVMESHETIHKQLRILAEQAGCNL